MLVKFVSVVCDNCGDKFISEAFWTPNFRMDTGSDYCPSCVIIKGGEPRW